MSVKKSVSEQKREAIIGAAIQEFKRKGFQSASMDSISAVAKVSKRTVYNHFESKELLFQEIAKQIFSLSKKVVDVPYDSNQSLEDQLMKHAHAELELLATDRYRDLARVMLAECVHSPELTAKAMAQFAEQEQGLHAWIAAAIADKRLEAVNVDYAASQFYGLIKATAFWPQLVRDVPAPDKALCEQVAKDTVLMFLSRYAINN